MLNPIVFNDIPSHGCVDPNPCSSQPIPTIWILQVARSLSFYKNYIHFWVCEITHTVHDLVGGIDVRKIISSRVGITYSPKNPDPSKVANLRTRIPAIQVQTIPLEGPRILREILFIKKTCPPEKMEPNTSKNQRNPNFFGPIKTCGQRHQGLSQGFVRRWWHDTVATLKFCPVFSNA